MKKSVLLIIITALCLSLTACQAFADLQQYQGSTAEEQYQADYDVLDKGPVTGGTLNLFTTEPDSLNPVLTKNTYTADILGFVYEGLTRLDSNQKPVAELSDKWTVSDDGLIWTFHIRDGVKWHDGEPFTAYDAEFTIQTILNPGISSVYKPLLSNVATCAAVDSSNLRVALERPNSFMPEMMTLPIIAKHQFAQEDVITASKQFTPVGTGPYRLVSYTENKAIEMKQNENWWNLALEENASLGETDGTDTGGTNAGDGGLKTEGIYIETILAKIYKNPDDAMGAFRTGNLDVAVIEAANYSRYRDRTDLTIKKFTSRDFEFLSFNLKNPIFEDLYVRKAVSMAIDIETIIQKELLGEAEASKVPILPGNWISDLDGVQTAILSIQPDVSTQDNMPAAQKTSPDKNTSAAQNTPASDDKAAAITAKTPLEVLKEGGWKENKQGLYKSIGGLRKYLKVELLVNTNNSTRVRIAGRICEQIVKAGIPAEVKEVPWDDMMNRIGTGKYDMAFLGCRIPQIPDLSYMYSNSYLSSAISGDSNAAYNVSGYASLTVDTGITELFRQNNTEQKKSIYKALLEQIEADSPYIGLYFLRNAMVYSKDIKGPLQPDTWNRYHDMYRWYKPEIP